MKILIAEDDFASRKFLINFLSDYGECDQVIDGLETVEAFMISIKNKDPYDLVCLDIMMPKVDGIRVLKTIRDIEKQHDIDPENGVKIIMISALNNYEVVMDSFNTGSEGYAVKPLNTDMFIKLMEKLDLIKK